MESFWQVVTVFLLLVAEEMGVPLPFVTSGLMVVLGVGWRQGSLSLGVILAIMATATVTGSLALYLLGRMGRRALADRLLPRRARDHPGRARLDAGLREHAFWAILFARFVPGLGPVASILAGAMRVPIIVLEAAALTASTGWTLFWLAGGSLGYTILAPYLGWLPPSLQLPAAVLAVVLALSLLGSAGRALWRVASRLARR